MPYGKAGVSSPVEVHNEALRLAQRAVAAVFDEFGDDQHGSICIKIVTRLEGMKRVKRKRRTVAEMQADALT